MINSNPRSEATTRRWTMSWKDLATSEVHCEPGSPSNEHSRPVIQGRLAQQQERMISATNRLVLLTAALAVATVAMAVATIVLAIQAQS